MSHRVFPSPITRQHLVEKVPEDTRRASSGVVISQLSSSRRMFQSTSALPRQKTLGRGQISIKSRLALTTVPVTVCLWSPFKSAISGKSRRSKVHRTRTSRLNLYSTSTKPSRPVALATRPLNVTGTPTIASNACCSSIARLEERTWVNRANRFRCRRLVRTHRPNALIIKRPSPENNHRPSAKILMRSPLAFSPSSRIHAVV
jgi:hypothetical protein